MDWPSGSHSFTLVPLGDGAVTVRFGREISPELNESALAFAETVTMRHWEGVLDVVPAYACVTIHVDPLRLPVSTLCKWLYGLVPGVTAQRSARTHRIPVLYGSEWGPDLRDLADFARSSIDEAIRLHCTILYRVYMLGFTPGFPYMGVVPAPIAMPRLSTPRRVVAAGSVGIAEYQTGIYPSATPGGWRIIGRTPVNLFQPKSSEPFLFRPGDHVQFYPINREEFVELSHAASA